jgi:hypothetical protein
MSCLAGCGKIPLISRFVTGHDFSRAERASIFARASAPAVFIRRFHNTISVLPQPATNPGVRFWSIDFIFEQYRRAYPTRVPARPLENRMIAESHASPLALQLLAWNLLGMMRAPFASIAQISLQK